MANAGNRILPHNGSCSGWPVTHETGEALKSFRFGVSHFSLSIVFTSTEIHHGATWSLMLYTNQADRKPQVQPSPAVVRARYLGLKQPMLPASSPNKNTLRSEGRVPKVPHIPGFLEWLHASLTESGLAMSVGKDIFRVYWVTKTLKGIAY